jgi:hypothetical protein
MACIVRLWPWDTVLELTVRLMLVVFLVLVTLMFGDVLAALLASPEYTACTE